jgi:hypothetical protein
MMKPPDLPAASHRARTVQDAARRREAPVPLRGIPDRACARCSFRKQVGTEGMSAPVEQKELA